MAFLKFPNVRIAGISAGVPKNIVYNADVQMQSSDYDAAAFIATTGVVQRRFTNEHTSSDLSYAAAEQLIADLNWDKSEIEALVFVSQTPDYILPATSCILQDRLGLSKECYAVDISLGCSGWVYGLSTVASLLATGSIKKALLLVGDAKARYKSNTKAVEDPLFGHAGTATAVEYKEGTEGFVFHLGTDGSGYDAIIKPDGGSRSPFSAQSFCLEEFEGKMMHKLQMRIKGMDVFAFGITVPGKSIKKLAKKYNFNYLDSDYFVFHQANLKINQMISKKLKLPAEKVPFSMGMFGNTYSATIPITIATELKGKIEDKKVKLICCGFGVGLSWGTVAFDADHIVISELVEI